MSGEGQTFRRWFVDWPATHVDAGLSVEVMPVADHNAAIDQLLGAIARIEVMSRREYGSLTQIHEECLNLLYPSRTQVESGPIK